MDFPIVELQDLDPIVLGYASQIALRFSGATKEFKSSTWNDIVKSLVTILEASGETWDSTYGNIDATYLQAESTDEKQKTLTANRFNAVTLNIDRILNNKWRWAVDESVEKGFLGRGRVRGLAQYGVRGADKVYGWYILELVRVLNLLIEIVQGSTDLLSELQIDVPVYSKTTVDAIALKIAPLFLLTSGKTSAEILLTLKKTIKMVSNAVLQSHANLDIDIIEPIVLAEKELIRSKSEAEVKLVVPRYTLIYVMECSINNMLDLEMITLKPVNIGAQALSRTLEKAEMHAPKATEIKSDSLQKSDADVNVVTAKPLPAFAEVYSKSNIHTEVICCKPKMIGANAINNSLSYSEMTNAWPKILECLAKSGTISVTELRAGKGVAFLLRRTSNSVVSASLSCHEKQKWFDPEQNGSNLYIRNVYMQHDETPNVHIGHKFLQAEQNGSDLYIKSVYAQNQYENDLDVGLVYYEPEQTGTDIYIRSAESLKGV